MGAAKEQVPAHNGGDGKGKGQQVSVGWMSEGDVGFRWAPTYDADTMVSAVCYLRSVGEERLPLRSSKVAGGGRGGRAMCDWLARGGLAGSETAIGKQYNATLSRKRVGSRGEGLALAQQRRAADGEANRVEKAASGRWLLSSHPKGRCSRRARARRATELFRAPSY